MKKSKETILLKIFLLDESKSVMYLDTKAGPALGLKHKGFLYPNLYWLSKPLRDEFKLTSAIDLEEFVKTHFDRISLGIFEFHGKKYYRIYLITFKKDIKISFKEKHLT